MLRFMGSQRVGHDLATELNCTELMLSRFSHIQLFVTPWTVAQQVPLSMGFSRQEYWSVLPCPPPRDLPKVQKARGTQYSWVGMKAGDRVWGSGVLVKLKNRLSFTTGMKGERP